jgi:Uma2 family endonuclease
VLEAEQHDTLWREEMKRVIERREVEYHNGHPVAKVSARRKHGLVQANLLETVRRCGRELGETAAAWRFDLGTVDDSITEYLPDVAFIGFERLDLLDDVAVEEPTGAPDVAVEIRSPGDWLAYAQRKISKYLACGASLVLDVDPEARTIEAHTQIGVSTFHVGETFIQPTVPLLRFEVDEAFVGIDCNRRTP